MKIAIIGKIHSDGLEILKKKKYEVIEILNSDTPSLKKNLADVDGIIIRTAKLTSEILAECKPETLIFELSCIK